MTFLRSGVILALALTGALAGSPPGTAAPAGAEVEVQPVTFSVTNGNGSLVPCTSDRKTHTVKGHLVAPAGGPTDGVTLYLHGLGHGEWLWSFDDVAGHNHAREMAALGHTSVVVDRVGYDESSHPEGTRDCIGSQADVASQIVGALRSGYYETGVGAPATFAKVVLAGLSAGGMIAEVAAYSFGGIDALAVLSYADQDASEEASRALAASGQVCATGGEAAEEGQPPGYAYFGQTGADFETLMFHDAQPGVVEAATARRNRDACGDFASLATAIAVNQAMVGTLSLPVLVACGRQDAVFPPPACERQAANFRDSRQVTTLFLDGTGHMLPLEKTAPLFRAGLSAWLTRFGA